MSSGRRSSVGLVVVVALLFIGSAATAHAEEPADEADERAPGAAKDKLAEGPKGDPVARYPLSPHQIVLQLGFQHWYGPTFKAPVGVSTPGLVLGVRPGIRFIEVRLHYTVSLNKIEQPDGVERRTGFANLDLVALFELRKSVFRVQMLMGPCVGFVHNGLGLGFDFGAVLGSRFLIDVDPVLAVGPFFDIRAQVYDLPGSDLPMYRFEDGLLVVGHSEAQIQLGVAFTFL